MKKIFTLLFVLSFGLLFSNTSKINDSKIVACPTATISYSGTPFCTSTVSGTVTLTGTDAYTGGTFSSSPASGLAINPTTGTISPSLSVPGAYIVLYEIAAGGGCPTVTTTTSVTINVSPTVTLSYPSELCTSSSSQSPTITGTGSYLGGTFSAMPGLNINAVNGTINPSSSTPSTYTITYTVPPSSGCGSASVTTNVTISPPPVVTITSNQTICSGNNTFITFTGTPNASVEYTINGGGILSIVLDSSGIATLSTGYLTSDTVYNLVSVSSATGCSVPVSGSVVITVIPNPTVIVTQSSPSICSGQSTNITFSSSNPGTTFQWNVVTTGATGASAGSGNTINQILTAAGSTSGQAVYSVIPFLNGCSGNPLTITVTVNSTPIITASPSSQTICSGSTTNIALTSSVSGTTYSWLAIPSGVMGAASGSGNTINQTLTTVGPNPGTVEYIITPQINGCTGITITSVVTVNPNPEVFVSSGGTIMCSGESSGITLMGNYPGTTFTLTSVQIGVTGATNGSSSTSPLHIDDILTATANTTGTVAYTIIPYFNGCSGNPIMVTITVHPLPQINISDGLICVDEITNNVLMPYVLDTGLPASNHTFEWFFNGNIIPGATDSTYSADMAGSYTVAALNVTTGCVSSTTANAIESYPAQSVNAAFVEQFDGNYTVTVTTNGNGTYFYQMDGGELQTSNVFTDVPFGLHTIHVTDSNGCSDIMTNIDLPEIIQQDLNVSPNPATDILTIRNDQIIKKVSALNHIGQLVFEKESNSKNVQIDISALNAGIYFVIITSDKTRNVKIIKN